ncbi:hypothetical protein N7467_001730 [Penicillium canescens]|nr:hypothetical protein N7467_001730 [Penicillium canescens]
MAQLDATFEKFDLPIRSRDKVQAVPGNLSQEYLDLGAAEFAHLAEKCSTIFLGAVVSWALPDDAHREVNVLGLVRVLGFASTHHPKSVHYFSSIATCGPVGFLPVKNIYQGARDQGQHQESTRKAPGKHQESTRKAAIIHWIPSSANMSLKQFVGMQSHMASISLANAQA